MLNPPAPQGVGGWEIPRSKYIKDCHAAVSASHCALPFHFSGRTVSLLTSNTFFTQLVKKRLPCNVYVVTCCIVKNLLLAWFYTHFCET